MNINSAAQSAARMTEVMMNAPQQTTDLQQKIIKAGMQAQMTAMQQQTAVQAIAMACRAGRVPISTRWYDRRAG